MGLSTFRFAWRSLSRRPLHAVLCIATLALGIGATTAIYSFVNALLLKPFPYPNPEQLVQIHADVGGNRDRLSAREVQDLNERSRLFEGFAAYSDTSAYNFAGGDGPPVEIPATIPTRNLFSVLGVELTLGETWSEASDFQPSYDVVLTDGLWRNRFGADPEVVGRQLEMDGAPYTIVGVAPPGFRFPAKAGLFRCQGIVAAVNYQQRENRRRLVVARIKPDVSLEAAQREVTAIAGQLAREFPDTNQGVRFVVTPLRDRYLGDSRPYLVTLLGAVGFVLLVACVNVANLMLIRASSQRRELAVRSALGAGRWRLAQQALAEGSLLALLGGIGGLGLAFGFTEALSGWVRAELPAWMAVRVDGEALAFLAFVTLAVGVLSALLPALRMARVDQAETLKEGARGSSGGERLHQSLILAETAATLVLLVGASLLLQSFVRLRANDVGFNPEQTLTFRVALPWKTYDTERTHNFYRAAVDEIGRIPGVESIELSSPMPLTGDTSVVPIALEGQTKAEWIRNPEPRYHYVTPGFHETFAVPLIKGRYIEERDIIERPLVCLVSRKAAEVLWPGQEAIGKRVRPFPSSDSTAFMQVVGIVDNVKYERPDEPDAASVYVPFFQHRQRNAYVLIKTPLEPTSLLDEATQAIWSVDPEQSVYEAATMDEHIHDLIWQRSIAGRLFGAFALLALLLAAVGLYGVVSYRVTERTQEMGIRAAIGASRRDLIALVVRQGLGVVLAGIAVGGAAALVLARSLRGLLFGVSATDPLSFVAVPAILLGVAGLACYFPARRAASVAPTDALRES